MSKFFITNNKSWYQQTKERISESDYSLAFDYVNDGVCALSTHKLKIKNNNAYEDANGDFVIATGTAIYKESLDYTSVIFDFESIGIEGIRNNTIGQYAYAIKKGAEINVFGDAIGAYNIYYYCDHGNFYVSNFLYDMAMVLSQYLSLNEMNLLEQAVQCAILNNETFFNEIKRLDGNESISIENGDFQIVTFIPHLPIYEDSKLAANKLAGRLSYKASVITKVLGDPSICMTGGLDSRMSLAAYLSVGAKPTLSFALSNTRIASPEQMDIDIIHKFTNVFELKENIHACDTRFPGGDWNYYLNKYGFSYTLWGGVKDVMHFFENMPGLLCTFGYGGELFRNVNLTESRTSDISIEELINEYFMRHGHAELDKYDELRNHIKNKLIAVAHKYNIDINHLHPEDVSLFFIEYRKVADSTTMNYINFIEYSNMLLMESDVVALCRIHTADMDKARYMLDTLNNLYPPVLEIPVFSHHKLLRYDPKKMILYSGLEAKRPLLLIRLKEIYKRFSFILKPARDLYKYFERNSSESTPKETIKKETPSFEHNYGSDNISFDNMNLTLQYVMNLKAITTILKMKN